MDLNDRIQLGNIEDKLNVMKGMGLSDQEINDSFSKAESDILEKARSHKYIRKEGDRYIYEENNPNKGSAEEQDLSKLSNYELHKISSNVSHPLYDVAKKEEKKRPSSGPYHAAGDDYKPKTELREGLTFSIGEQSGGGEVTAKITNIDGDKITIETYTKKERKSSHTFSPKEIYELIEEGGNKIQKSEDESKEKKVAKVMAEFKAGTLKSSSGEVVTDKDQAIAIAMSEAGMSKKD